MLIHILTVALKELRELVSRPWQAVTLILGPLTIMVAFGIGANTNAEAPTAIVVVPPGQERPRLLRDYQNQFEQFLRVVAYTEDEAYAREQLRRDAVQAVVILPPAPFQTIAAGQQASIRVVYNQIDPLWRWVVPNFSQVMAAAINREIFLQTIGAQQSELTATLRDVELLADTLEVAISAADVGDRVTTREQVQQARDRSAALDDALAPLGPEVVSLREQIARLQASLQRADEQLAPDAQPSPTSQQPLRERLGLVAARQSVQTIGDILRRFTTIAPEVVISPLTIDAQNVAQLEPDIVTFFAPSLLALLVQHIAVSMGVLAIVRERLGGMFELYRVAPLRNLGLLLGKYVAYSGFTLVIASIVLGVLLWGIGVPVLGSPWQLGVTLVLLTLASVGLGLLLSLLALSEHQAVQFAMLTLLAIVFFSGFVLPLDAISRPLRIVSALLPATHGVVLLQNAMLRGGPVDTQALFALLAMALLLFGTCLGVLHWRTRPM